MRCVPAAMASDPFVLASREGELISVRVAIEPRRLEELLECLAELPFPVNPQIYHTKPTIVEFPAYASHLIEVREALAVSTFPAGSLTVTRMIEQIGAA